MSIQVDVKFEVTFFHDYREFYPCRANVRTILPISVTTEKLLPDYITCPSRILAGEYLTQEWGTLLTDVIYGEDEDEQVFLDRYQDKVFFAQSWKSLQEQINNFVSDTVDSMNKVLEYNRYIVEEQPNYYEVTFTASSK